MGSCWVWLGVAFLSMVPLGNYFLFDLPGAIGTGSGETWQRRFAHHHHEYTQTMNGLLYSIYSWPNLVLAMVGGVLVDNFLGVQRSALLFTCLVLLGSYITYLGVVATSFDLLLVGRIIFGFGGETQIVAQYSFIGNWFDGRPGAGIAFGLIAAVQRIGAGATFWLGPRIAEESGVLNATFAAVVVSAASVCALLVTMLLHRKASARPSDVMVPDEGVFQNMKNAVTLPILTLALGNGLVSMALYGFAAIAVRLLEVCAHDSAADAGTAVTTFYVVVVVAAPVLGSVIENTGKQLAWLVIGSVSAGLLTLAFSQGQVPGHIYCGLLAIPQAIVLSGVYPIVSRYVRVDSEGFAFGLLVSMQNAGMAAATLGNGLTLDQGVGSSKERYVTILVGQAGLYFASAVAFAVLGCMRELPPVPEKVRLVDDSTATSHPEV